MKWGPEHAQKHDLSSLRLLGSVGEPINPEAWVWYHEHIGGGDCPIVDTWWQTETGMILITPLPGVTHHEAGLRDEAVPRRRRGDLQRAGEEVGPGGGGYLVLASRGRRCCAGSTGDDDRYRRDVLVEVTATCTSPATARGSTRTATSGCSAASTT